VQARFLLGPAGSGKTFRCLTEIHAALRENPEGAPLVLLAPKQAAAGHPVDGPAILADGHRAG